MAVNPVWGTLDRFVQDPYATYGNLALEESYLCEWCNKTAIPGERLCPACKEEDKIRQMEFGKFLEQLQEEAGSDYQQTLVPESGYLLFNWLFTSEYEAGKITKLLKARGAKHLSTKLSVTFWLGVDRHEKFDFREA